MGKPFRIPVLTVLSILILITSTVRVQMSDAASPPAKPSVNGPVTTKPAGASPVAEGKPTATLSSPDRVSAALDRKVSLDFADLEILEVAKKLSAMTGIRIECDDVVLTESTTFHQEVPFTIHVHDVSLRSALQLLLAPRKMTTVKMAGDVLLITTIEAANSMLNAEMVVDASPTAPAPVSRVAAALDKNVSLKFEDEPLDAVRQKIMAMTGIPVEIDEPALKEADKRLDMRMTFTVKDVSLRSALRLLLRPHSLTTTITRDDTLLITTYDVANVTLTVKLYNVRDLIETPDDLGEIQQDYKSLINVVTSIFRPQSWDAIGGPGSIQGIRGALAIYQTDEVHEEIVRLLAALREVRQRQEKSPGGPAIRFGVSSAQEKCEQRFQKLLVQPCELNFKDRPLKEAMDALAKRYQVNIQIDEAALREAGIGSDTKISFELKGLSLRAALQRILKQLHLTYYLADEVLLVTEQSTNCFSEVTRLYPVADLVKFHDTNAVSDKESGSDALIDSIEAIVRSQSWDIFAGPGSITYFAPAKVFVVFQSPEAHQELEAFFAQLRANLREHPPTPPAKQVAFEDRLIAKVFELKPSTDKNYVAAAIVADIVKNATGAKAWLVEGTIVMPSERVEAKGGSQPDNKIIHPSLVIRNKPAVLRDARRLLKELNVWPEPVEKVAVEGGTGPAFNIKPPAAGTVLPPEAGQQNLTDTMPAPAKCEGHDEVCPVPAKKPAGP